MIYSAAEPQDYRYKNICKAREAGGRCLRCEPPRDIDNVLAIAICVLEHLSIVRGVNMADSYTNLLYHIVFSTKDRRPLITSEYELVLYDYIDMTRSR